VSGWLPADPALLAGVLPAGAMAVRGAFHPDGADGVPAVAGRPAGTLVLLGWTGGAQWAAFAGSAEAGDGRAEPLDRWTRRLVDAAAAALGARAVYPGEGPPFWPFQRWAMRAEGIAPSPLGLLIHRDWGVWHSYRAALVLAGRLDLVAVPARASPCDGCARPCLEACPVAAFDGAGYDAAGCAAHLAGPVECLEDGCRARVACPVVPPVPYGAAQMRFHMAALRRGFQ